MKAIRFGVALVCFLYASGAYAAAEYYVAVDGKTDNAGTATAPWDLESAFRGVQQVAPGDTIWVRGGTYKHPDRQPGTNGVHREARRCRGQADPRPSGSR